MSEAQSNEANIFNAARKIKSSEDQAAYLKEACGEESGLQQRVEKLLSAYLEESQFLEQPAAELEATILPDKSRDNLAESLEAGLAASFGEEEAVVIGRANHSVLKTLGQTMDLPRVSLRPSAEEGPDSIVRPNSTEMPMTNPGSRYQLQGEIARGGMGAVIRGRDTDLGRDLAIKVLLDDHKDKPEIVQRFVEEAQIGGQLQHPGIAPVYELGQFADQRPFFSMKLVKGKTLSEILADREDATADRGKLLGIFEQMCQTMAYAHSRGVIHRDLKPANIMIGAFGEVQVMDWGLAKVLSKGGVADEKKAHTKLNDVSIIQTLRSVGSDAPGTFGTQGSETQMGSVMGTPAYMPPEQALGEIDNLDERADVFGLGAILCEILTGQPPYVGTDGNSIYRQAARGKLGDCFERLDACEADAELITLTKHCLELEPEDRPRDAGVLAEQVAHYLESVENKLRETEREKADAQIRTEELRRRNKLAITAGTAIAAVLLIGISVSAWQAVRATNAETLARNEAVRAMTAEGEAKVEAARALEAEKLAKAETTRATTAEKKTAETLVEVAAERDAKELARKEAEEITKFLSKVFRSPDPARDGRTITVAETLDTAAKNLETDLADQPAQRAKLQDTLGSTYHALGLYQQAISLREKVRDYRFNTLGQEHSATLGVMLTLGNSYYRAGRHAEALEIRDEVLKLRRKVSGPEDPRTISALHNLAESYSAAGRQDEALEMREETLKLRLKLSGPEDANTLRAMLNLANSYSAAGRQVEALEMREETLILYRKVLGPEHPETLISKENLAISYNAAGRQDEGLEMQEEVLILRRKVSGPEHPKTLGAMGNLAIFYNIAGRQSEALELQEEVLELRRKVSGPEHPKTHLAMQNLAISYNAAGRQAEALEMREETLILCRKVLGPEDPKTIIAMEDLAESCVTTGRQDEALELREEVLELRRKVSGPEHPITIIAMENLAVYYDATGRQSEALELREELLELRRKVSGLEDHDTLKMMVNLANSYYSADRQDEALELLEEVLKHCRKVLDSEHPITIIAMENLAVYYDAAGRQDEALELREELLILRRKVLGPEHSETLGAMENLANSYYSADRQDEALEMREEILLLYRKVSGPEHPDTLGAMIDLASSYDAVGRVDKVLEMKEEILIFCRKVLGPEAPDTLGAMTNLANSYSDVGRVDEAIELLEKSLKLKRRVLPRNHPFLIIAMKSLARCYGEIGRQDEVLELREDVLGPEHADTLRAMMKLAISYYDLGRPDESLQLREEVLKIRRKALGPENPDTLGTMTDLAVSYYQVGRVDEAIELLEKSLNLKRRVLPQNHPFLLVALNHLATWYSDSDRLEEATSLWEEYSVRKPEYIMVAMKVAALQVWLSKDAEYLATCERMLKWAKEGKNPNDIVRIAWLSCLRSISDDKITESALTLAQRAVEIGPENKELLPWYHTSLGAAEFRSGNYTKADKALITAAETASDNKDDTQRDWIESTSKFYHAMSLFQQGKPDEARTLFTEAEAKMKPLPADEKNPLADNADADADDLILWLAYKEAKALLAEKDTNDE